MATKRNLERRVDRLATENEPDAEDVLIVGWFRLLYHAKHSHEWGERALSYEEFFGSEVWVPEWVRGLGETDPDRSKRATQEIETYPP